MVSFSKRDLWEMMLHLSGSSTSLPDEKNLEIKNVFDELKKIRDALSFIQEIFRKQENNESLTENDELFVKYVHMVSEFLMMSQTLNEMMGVLESYKIRELHNYKIQNYIDDKRKSFFYWITYTWTTNFDGMTKVKRIAFPMNRRTISQTDADILQKKFDELTKYSSDFFCSIIDEDTSLKSTRVELIDQVKQQQIVLQAIESIFLLNVNDMIKILTSSEEITRRSNVLTHHFGEIMPKVKELTSSYDNFVERCNALIQKKELKIESDDDEVLFLYRFCRDRKRPDPNSSIRNSADPFPFPGKQDEDAELIPIPPKGERTEENMCKYLSDRWNEFNKKK